VWQVEARATDRRTVSGQYQQAQGLLAYHARHHDTDVHWHDTRLLCCIDHTDQQGMERRLRPRVRLPRADDTVPTRLCQVHPGVVGAVGQYVVLPYLDDSHVANTDTFTSVGTNCIAIYSASLSITQFARPLAIIPRSLYTIPVFVGILLLGLAGRDHLLSVLENFLSLLGYWNTAFFAILFTEHYLFRHGQVDRYDLEGWNDPSRLPLGIAGGLAFAVGIVGGVLGMTQTWYVGVVAKLIGDAGGDVGNELALVMTLCTYVPARWAERKYLGR
jgi:hypothetical protein